MSDLDHYLEPLRTITADPRLATIDGAVMAGLAARRERAVARRSLALAGLLAIGIGWMGSIMPASPARAAPPAMFGMSDYAPSRLLGE